MKHKSKKLFRRQGCYSEVWRIDQIVLAIDEEAAAEWDEGQDCQIIYAETYDEAHCAESEFIEADEVEEVVPGDLDDAEARKVAEYLAEGTEYDAVKQMNAQEVREWLERKLVGKGQPEKP